MFEGGKPNASFLGLVFPDVIKIYHPLGLGEFNVE